MTGSGKRIILAISTHPHVVAAVNGLMYDMYIFCVPLHIYVKILV